MSGKKCFECILIYSDLDIGFSKGKSFRSHDINLTRRRASEILQLKSSFYSKKDAYENDAYSRYPNLSPPTVNLNLNGYDFRGR